jgi:hypothetical protein
VKLKVQDIVRVRPIPPGRIWWEVEQSSTLAVVERVNHRGAVALVLPEGSKHRVAWYDPDELDFVSSLADLVGET